VIFDRAKGKAKRDESTGKDGSNRLGKKKNKKNNGGLARGHCRPQGRQGGCWGNPRPLREDAREAMPKPRLPIKHLYKDCTLLKKYLLGGSRKGEQKKKPDASDGDAEGKDDGFLDTNGCLMIFRRPSRLRVQAPPEAHMSGGLCNRTSDACVSPVVGVSHHLRPIKPSKQRPATREVPASPRY
jgi:hypothetical protein